jgi:hypothetical protein
MKNSRLRRDDESHVAKVLNKLLLNNGHVCLHRDLDMGHSLEEVCRLHEYSEVAETVL